MAHGPSEKLPVLAGLNWSPSLLHYQLFLLRLRSSLYVYSYLSTFGTRKVHFWSSIENSASKCDCIRPCLTMLHDNNDQYASHRCIMMLNSEVTSIQHVLSGAKSAVWLNCPASVLLELQFLRSRKRIVIVSDSTLFFLATNFFRGTLTISWYTELKSYLYPSMDSYTPLDSIAHEEYPHYNNVDSNFGLREQAFEATWDIQRI